MNEIWRGGSGHLGSGARWVGDGSTKKALEKDERSRGRAVRGIQHRSFERCAGGRPRCKFYGKGGKEGFNRKSFVVKERFV